MAIDSAVIQRFHPHEGEVGRKAYRQSSRAGKSQHLINRGQTLISMTGVTEERARRSQHLFLLIEVKPKNIDGINVSISVTTPFPLNRGQTSDPQVPPPRRGIVTTPFPLNRGQTKKNKEVRDTTSLESQHLLNRGQTHRSSGLTRITWSGSHNTFSS